MPLMMLRKQRRKQDDSTMSTSRMLRNIIQLLYLVLKCRPNNIVRSIPTCLATNKRLANGMAQEGIRTMLLINSVATCQPETKFTTCTKPCLVTVSP